MSRTLREKILAVAQAVQEYALYAVVFFIPISQALIESFFCMAWSAFIVKKIISPDFTFIKNRIHFLLLLFYIFCLVSLSNSGIYIGKSFHAWFFKWGEGIILFLLVQDAFVSGKGIRHIVRILLFSGCLVAVDGIFQHFYGWDFLRGRPILTARYGVKAITGPFHHYNDFAAYLVCSINLFIAMILGGNGFKFPGPFKGRVIYYGKVFSLFLLWGCLLLTFSRGGWCGLLFSGALLAFLSPKKKFIGVLFCFFMLMVFLVPHVRERALFTFTCKGDSSRFAIWQGAWGMIKAHPFLGNGIGTFMDRFGQFTKGIGVQYAHNCYLQIWAETGIWALLSFIGFLFLLLSRGIEAFRRSHNYLILGVLCAIFGFLVHSFFDTHLYSLQLAMLFWYLAGMLQAVAVF